MQKLYDEQFPPQAFLVNSVCSNGDILCVECFKADFIDNDPGYSVKYRMLDNLEYGVTCDCCEEVIYE